MAMTGSSTSVDYHHDCKCTRPCSKLSFVSTKGDPISTSLTPNIDIEISDMVEFKSESLAYTSINLIIDIAGNIGLYFGLSILSVLVLGLDSVSVITKRLSRDKIKNSYVNGRICALWLFHAKKKTKSAECFRHTKIKVTVWIISACIALVLINLRIKYYFTRPVRTIIELSELTSVLLPNITVCFPSWEIIELKKEFARKENLTSWQNVDLLDLTTVRENVTIEDLWQMSLEKAKQYAFLPDKELHHRNKTWIPTPDGNCNHLSFKFVKEKFRGGVANCAVQYPRARIYEGLTYKVYTSDTKFSGYNILNEIVSPMNKRVLSTCEIKNILRLNTPLRPCTELEIFNDCRENCTLGQFLGTDISDICHLPFLPLNAKLEPCNSLRAAKRSLKRALNILTRISTGQICGCGPSCSENVFYCNTKYGRANDTWKFVDFKNPGNFGENVIDIADYTFIAFLCDIGNILGIVLGTSVLNMAYNIQRATNSALHTALAKYKHRVN